MNGRIGVGLLCATLSFSLGLGGCASAFFGPPPPRMNDAVDLKPAPGATRQDYQTIKEAIRRELSIGNPPPTGDVTPAEYVKAGYNFVFRNCSNYFDALIEWQNTNHYTNDVVVAGGSAAGAILGLAKASSSAIGGVAAGVGFASTAITAFDTRALVTPYPNETKTLILRQLANYREAVPPDTVTDDAAAIANVQRFAEVCTYSGISRAAKQALSNFDGAVTKPASAGADPLAALSAKLGLAEPMSPEALVALYVWAEASPPVSDDPVKGPQVRALLPRLDGPLDPKALDARVGGELRQAYDSDPALRRAVQDYEAKLDQAAASPPLTSPPPVGAEPPSPGGAAPPPRRIRHGAARRRSIPRLAMGFAPVPVGAGAPTPPLVRPDAGLLDRLAQRPPKAAAETIGQFDLSGQKPAPR